MKLTSTLVDNQILRPESRLLRSEGQIKLCVRAKFCAPAQSQAVTAYGKQVESRWDIRGHLYRGYSPSKHVFSLLVPPHTSNN